MPLPLSCSATVQHSSRLKQKTSAGVRRLASSPSAIYSICSISSSVADPMKRQRHLAVAALHQFQLAIVAVLQPLRELEGVAHRGRKQQRADVLRQQAERQFPDDAPLAIVEAVELVHHHGA